MISSSRGSWFVVLDSCFKSRTTIHESRFTILLGFLILFFSSNCLAQAPGEQEYTVLGISVEGNVSGNAETIIAQSTIRKGDKIQTDAIRRAITRLWQQGIFSDVNIEATKV